MTLMQEKVDQAIEILREQGTDVWLTFVRETSGVRDPMLDFLIGPNDLTWPSALILTRQGEKIAIVGNLEKDSVSRNNVFDTIIGYDTAVSAPLRETITRLNPNGIAINTSRNNVHADGLTHAMYEILCDYLKATPYTERFVSAEPIVNAMRGRKTAAELERIRSAVQITDEIYKKTFDFLKVGMTEIEVANYMHTLMKEYGVGYAWSRENNPAVNSGPNKVVGHSGPTEIKIERGHLIHFDFGVKYEDYCSDIQRVGYVLREGEAEAPLEVQRGFLTIRTQYLPEGVELAAGYRRADTRLSLPDAFALALAKQGGHTLLAGDASLRALAETERVECHGVLWALDEIARCELAPLDALHAALTAISAHPRCRLPGHE